MSWEGGVSRNCGIQLPPPGTVSRARDGRVSLEMYSQAAARGATALVPAGDLLQVLPPRRQRIVNTPAREIVLVTAAAPLWGVKISTEPRSWSQASPEQISTGEKRRSRRQGQGARGVSAFWRGPGRTLMFIANLVSTILLAVWHPHPGLSALSSSGRRLVRSCGGHACGAWQAMSGHPGISHVSME